MRIILLLQSIIIIVGAYYIYLQSQQKPVVVPDTTPTLEVVPMPDTREGYQPPTENPPDIAPAIDASSTVTGPSDAGMEYPIMDEEVRPEVR